MDIPPGPAGANRSPDPPNTSPHTVEEAYRDDAGGRDARGRLVQRYSGPVYFLYLRRGDPPARAEPLAADFLTHFFLLPTAAGHLPFMNYDPAKGGRLREFVFRAAGNYRISAHRKAGDAASLDELSAATGFEPAAGDEAAFFWKWAQDVLAEAVAAARAEYETRGQADLFAALLDLLVTAGPAAAVTQAFGMSAGHVAVEKSRLKGRIEDHLKTALRKEYPDGTDLAAGAKELFALAATRPPV